MAKEIPSPMPMTWHNLTYFEDLMAEIRAGIGEGKWRRRRRGSVPPGPRSKRLRRNRGFGRRWCDGAAQAPGFVRADCSRNAASPASEISTHF